MLSHSLLTVSQLQYLALKVPRSLTSGLHVTCRNVAAAERTLQKQLAVVKESKEEVRPEFIQRLTGTLADVIARAAQQEAASAKHTQSQPDRMPEVIGLLQTAFEVSLSTCHRCCQLHLPKYTWQQCRCPLVAHITNGSNKAAGKRFSLHPISGCASLPR